MSFVAKGGRVVTDDMLDKWADDADNGEFGRKAGCGVFRACRPCRSGGCCQSDVFVKR